MSVLGPLRAGDPRRLGPYVVTGLPGSGGQGVVHLATGQGHPAGSAPGVGRLADTGLGLGPVTPTGRELLTYREEHKESTVDATGGPDDAYLCFAKVPA